jgi:hypothetical protein
VSRLSAAFEELVENPLPEKLKAPTPYFTREDEVAPTELALQEKARHLEMVAKAWEELNKLLERGIFKVSNKTREAESISEEDEALIGSEFEDDRIDWKVVKVAYSVKEKEVMAWYYDVAEAARLDLSEVEIESALDEDPYTESLGPVERSRVAEIRDWLGE